MQTGTIFRLRCSMLMACAYFSRKSSRFDCLLKNAFENRATRRSHRSDIIRIVASLSKLPASRSRSFKNNWNSNECQQNSSRQMAKQLLYITLNPYSSNFSTSIVANSMSSLWNNMNASYLAGGRPRSASRMSDVVNILSSLIGFVSLVKYLIGVLVSWSK